MEDQFRHEFLTHAWQTATPDDLPKRIPVSLLNRSQGEMRRRMG